jgi:hypothetical protein
MTLPLPSRFDERRIRLVLGLEPRDAIRQCRITHPVELVVERPRFVQPFLGPPLTATEIGYLRALKDARVPLDREWTRVPRHPSGRHAVIAAGAPPARIDIRVLDPERRYASRRLRIPLDAAPLDDVPIARRSRAPWLWPGAAYPVVERATGLRGRVVVVQGGVERAVRWPRVLVRATPGGARIAWAHGDDRGDFLLILPPESLGLSAELAPLTLTVEVRGRLGDPPSPPPQAVRDADPWWDLPPESLALPPTTPDEVAEGRSVPPELTGSVSRQVTFVYSVILSGTEPPFVIS